jgi:hypothetical protein
VRPVCLRADSKKDFSGAACGEAQRVPDTELARRQLLVMLAAGHDQGRGQIWHELHVAQGSALACRVRSGLVWCVQLHG